MTNEATALAIARIFAEAEARILARVTAAIAQGLDASEPDRVLLARLQTLRGQALVELSTTLAAAAQSILEALSAAYDAGGASMLADIRHEIDPVLAGSNQLRASVRIIAGEIVDGVQSSIGQVLRTVDDGFRSVVAAALAESLPRGTTRRLAGQRALDRAFGDGLRFVDRGGRLWRLPDYIEMAVRTGQQRAEIAGHEDTLDRAGLDLVVVQPGPRACRICDKWARKVLARRGAAGKQTMESVTTGEPVTVVVHATLAQARADGFQHPNCRCRLRAYLPGATDPSVLQRPAWDQSGYEAQQRQRALERRVRNAKLSESTSIDGPTRQRASQRVRDAQRDLRAHLGEHTQLKRRSEREQITGRFATPDERARARRRREVR